MPQRGRRVGRVLSVLAVVALLSAGFLSVATEPQTPSVPSRFQTGSGEPAVGSYVGWRDDFVDTSKVAASSNLVFSGSVVRLPVLDLNNLTRVGLMLARGSPGDFDSVELGGPTVVSEPGVYKMWYFGSPGGTWSIGYATSPNGVAWTKQGPVLSPSLPEDSVSAAYPEVVKVGSGYYMWYSGSDGSNYRILLATSSTASRGQSRGWCSTSALPGPSRTTSYTDRP